MATPAVSAIAQAAKRNLCIEKSPERGASLPHSLPLRSVRVAGFPELRQSLSRAAEMQPRLHALHRPNGMGITQL
jgi:hypothetical protein